MWDIDETRRLVHTKFGHKQLAYLNPSLRSLVDRQIYARYHFQEAMKLFSKFSSENLGGEESLSVLIEDALPEFNVLVRQVGAHAAACLQSLHAIADILAHSIYFSLGMNLAANPLEERRINIQEVTNRLTTKYGFSLTADAINSLVKSSDYKYLAAAANLSKHRSVVGPCLQEDWTGCEPKLPEISLQSFTYRNKRYPSRTMKEVVVPVYEGLSKLVVDTGNHINVHLTWLAKPSSPTEIICAS